MPVAECREEEVKTMEKLRMALLALGIAAILSMPVFGIALATPAADVVANIQVHQDSLRVKLLAPLADRSDWYGGTVIPVRVLVTDEDNASVSNATVTIWVNGTAATSPGHSFMGNTMVLAHDGMYQFNLETKPYPAGPGSSPITITIKATTPEDKTGGLAIIVSLN